MKILEVIESLMAGGAQRFVVDLCNELAENREDKVFLYTFREGKNYDFYRTQIHSNVFQIKDRGKETFLSKVWQFFEVLRVIIKVKPDIVHCHTLAFPYIIIPSLFLHRTKFFYTVHNMADKDTAPGLSSYLRSFFLKRTIKAITISTQCAISFENYYGFPCYKIIENGCRKLFVTNKLPCVNKEITSYKKNEHTKVFINIARIMPQKNHELLIKTFDKFVNDGYNAILLIIGDNKTCKDLTIQLKKLIHNNSIFFLGLRNNVSDYLYYSDFFCLSSSWEGLPISLLEAGLMGCYPISTPVGGVPDVIKNISLGLLSKDITIPSYLEMLKKAYFMNINRDILSQQYSEKYSMTLCARRYRSLFGN